MSKRKLALLNFDQCFELEKDSAVLQSHHLAYGILTRRDTSCAPWKNGDLFCWNDKWYIICGTAIVNGHPCIMASHMAIAESFKLETLNTLSVKKIAVEKIIGHEPYQMTPFELPDCFLVSKNWKRPCHRVVLSKHCGKLSEQIRELKPGGEINLPEQFTEAIIDDILTSIYEAKPTNPEIVSTQLLLEWGFYTLIEFVKDIPIDADNLAALSEAVFSGRYGYLPRIRATLTKALSQ